MEERTLILQQLLDVFSDTDLSYDQIRRALLRHSYNFDAAFRELSLSSPDFDLLAPPPTVAPPISRRTTKKSGNAKPPPAIEPQRLIENPTIDKYDTYAVWQETLSYRSGESLMNAKEFKHPTTLLGMSPIGAFQALLRRLASMIPGESYEFKVSIPLRTDDDITPKEAKKEQMQLVNVVKTLLVAICGVSPSEAERAWEEQKGTITVHLKPFTPCE
jgi:hypothetical protein